MPREFGIAHSRNPDDKQFLVRHPGRKIQQYPSADGVVDGSKDPTRGWLVFLGQACRLWRVCWLCFLPFARFVRRCRRRLRALLAAWRYDSAGDWAKGSRATAMATHVS